MTQEGDQKSATSQIHLLGSVALYVPAWVVAHVREHRIDAGLGFLVAHLVGSFPVLLGHCVELADLDATQRLTPQLQRKVVAHVPDDQQCHCGDGDSFEESDYVLHLGRAKKYGRHSMMPAVVIWPRTLS